MTDEILQAWDELNQAIQKMLVSQPTQLSAAAEELAATRQNFDALVRKAIRSGRPGSTR